MERLRVIREALGLTIEDVAAKAGLDPTYLSRIERGERVPSVRVLARLGRALGLRDISLEQLGLYGEKAAVG